MKNKKGLKKMKTRKQKIWGVIATLIMVFPFVLGLGNAKNVFADDNTDMANIIIHKKKMTGEKVPNPLIQNSGNEMTEFDNYQGLAGVTFSVYDVTTEFYNSRAAGTSVDDAKAEVKNLTPNTPIAQGTTNADGNLTLNLPKKQNGKDAVYTIKEEPKDGVVPADNMVVAFPVYEMIKQTDGSYKYGTEELSTIHIYPKNVVSNDGSLQVKKVGTAKNEGLNGAEFIISKSEGESNTVKYIQGVKDGLYTWTMNKEKAKHFITGYSYGIGENKFTEAENAEGELNVKNLEAGAYTLEEVKAPNNAALIDNQTKTSFTISTEKQTVELTIKNDTSKVEKTTPQLEGKDVAIGEKIQYQISVNIPSGIADNDSNGNKYVKFNLVDTHDAALTFDNQTSGDYGYVLYDGEKVISSKKYQVTEQDNGFTVAVNPEFIPSLTPGGTLKFVYFMHLNDKADPTKGFKNEANVDNGHTSDPNTPSVEVVTGGKRFIKVDGDVTSDKTSDKPLAGASFVVRDQDSNTAKYLKIDDTTKAVSWVDAKEATIFTTKKDGLVPITGLKYGTYFLEETVAPNDYVLLSNRIEFTVNGDSYGTTENLINPEKVPNKHKGTLPSTGGKGIYAFIAIGTIAVAGAVFYFTRGRKQTEA
ncbi:fimbrial isopeptide formation D2 domain-containing protein [Enterococcus raffinosus ATCC 49464]|uniref:Fimbrial isopeptide formation D2 domain-containing protein n=2 Tax=Enterococcus TaxID=1350 RepID=R2NU20_9ENTE|nr:fimbrial isopeptide formation D2 domain-containing protein [Enterococcus raffinosus ATCC 49464]EOT70868.1 LPXTG-protein cell wall anchor protein [Enterococcus raffinosus ATCC 49464]